MNEADRTSIHEAMEQQSISISKAGIVTSLQARCCVIAAANPLRSGRYNPALPLSQNVDLTEPILSRFDISLVIRDQVDVQADERLARFVVASHRRATLSTAHETPASAIDQALLRKYIQYARLNVKPTLSQLDVDKLSRLYGELRAESSHSSTGLPITVRHVESIVRMAEARARMHLRERVISQDLDVAIRVALESFVNAQRWSARSHLQRSFSRYLTSGREQGELLLLLLSDLARHYLRLQLNSSSGALRVPILDLEKRANEMGILDCRALLQQTAIQRLLGESGWSVQGETHLERQAKA